MRPIDADAIQLNPDLPYKASVRRVLAQAPTVDAVPVVRCKDCDMWCEEMKVGYDEFGNETAPCSEWSNEDGFTRFTKATDYCSYGERKEE